VAGDISVSRHPVDRLSIRRKREWTVPLAGSAIHPPGVQAIRLNGKRRLHAHDRLEISVDAIAQEVALEKRDAARRRL